MAYDELASLGKGEPSREVQKRTTAARNRQRERFREDVRTHCNADMGAKQMQKYCQPTEGAQDMLKMAITELNFSARAYDRILKVARTIADMEEMEQIEEHHIAEAIQYRSLDRLG